MATEEVATASEEVAKSALLPPYPEMILAAIEALKDKQRSNKSAISNYMVSKYGDLPPAHGSLLRAHLARMNESGELIFRKNNYFRADAPDAPPKRGRGRPPKSKDPNAPPPKRGRGRPPKSHDPEAEAADPPKKPKTAPAPAADGSTPAKRGRGRPRKVRPAEPAAA